MFQSFFGFGQSADIDVILDGRDTRKYAEIKAEDGRKEKHLLYYDGESVSGKVGFIAYTQMNVKNPKMKIFYVIFR